MAIEAVIFDIGNVLVEWHPERPFDRLLGEARRKELFAKVDFMGMNDRSDLGTQSMADGVAELAQTHPEDAEDIKLWAEHWLEMLAPDLPLSAHVLRALRSKGMAVHALSNFGDATFDLAESRYPVLKEFDQRFISARLNMMKPDDALYAYVETELNLKGEALYFIDDRDDNIAAAAARGWNTHLFTTSEKLAADLVSKGLLSQAEIST